MNLVLLMTNNWLDQKLPSFFLHKEGEWDILHVVLTSSQLPEEFFNLSIPTTLSWVWASDNF
jgi:hypothetical protein